MRRKQTRNGEVVYELHLEDYQEEDLKLPETCVMCKKLDARFKLALTGEWFCQRCMLTQNSIFLPLDHPKVIEDMNKLKEGSSRKMNKGERVQRMLREVVAIHVNGGVVDNSTVTPICRKYDLDFMDFFTRRHEYLTMIGSLNVKDVPMGGTLEDLERANQSMNPTEELKRMIEERKQFSRCDETEYFYQEAVEEVVTERRDINEVAEEYEVDIEELKLRVERRKVNEPELTCEA